MNKKLFITLGILLSVLTVSFTQDISLKGIVKDSKTKRALSNVNIVFPALKTGCATNDLGAFSIKVPKGKQKIRISLIGYETKNLVLDVNQTGEKVNIFLTQTTTNLQNVEVFGSRVERKGEETAKIDVPMKDVPVTLSSVNRNLIDQTQVSTVNEALRYTTGITPYVNYGGFQTFSMRGFGAPIIMVDGARDERMNLSNSAPLTTLASVERIEYLKGPASVLYGHSAVGGILNIIRKQPSSDFRANVSMTYGSYDTKSIEVGAEGGIVKDLTYRFDANLSDSKGWRDNYKKYSNAYLALNYKISDKNKLEFRFGVNDDMYGTEAGLPTIYQGDIYDNSGNVMYKKGDFPKGMKREQRYNDPSDFLHHKDYNASVKFNHDFNKNSKLTFTASYSSNLIDYFSTEELSFKTSEDPIYNTYYLGEKEKKTYIDLENLHRTYPLRFSHETDTYQHYLDYTNKFYTGKVKHNLLAGYYLSILDRTSFDGYNLGSDVSGSGLYGKVSVINPVLNQGTLITKFSGASSSKHIANGFYAQDVLDISKQLKAMVGVRLDRYTMKAWRSKVTEGRETKDPSEKKKIVNTPLSARVGLVYEPMETLSFYASYSSFFKPNRSTYSSKYIYIDKDGNEFFPTENKEVFKPENGYQSEVGVKLDLNKKLQVNASAFYIQKNNIIEKLGKTERVEQGKKVTKYIYGQVGRVASKGIDLELLWNPIAGLTLNTGYGYLEAKYKSFSTNKYSTNSKEGKYLSHNPRHKFYFWGYYTVPKGLLKNFSIGVGNNYSSSNFFNPSNTVKVNAYSVTDMALGYTFDNVYLKFKLNNVFDRTYYNNAVNTTQFIPAEGRNFLFAVGYKL